MTQTDIQLEVTYDKNPEPTKSPARSVSDALIGFSFAAFNTKARHITINEQQVYKDNLGRNSLRVTPLITFTRFGPQEFASGSEPWWDRA